MIVNCTECGQKHRLDPQLMNRNKAKIKCKSCGVLLTVYRSGSGPESIMEVTEADLLSPALEEPPAPGRSTAKIPTNIADQSPAASTGFKAASLRLKLMLFFLTPLIIVLVVGGYFFVRQMDALGNAMTDESLKMLTSVAENEVMEYSKAIAQQVQIYLAIHPELKKTDFNKNVDLNGIAVQRITLTMRGDTSIYEPTSDGKQIFWAHANPQFIGRDAGSLQDIIGRGFNDFVKIIRNGRDNKEASGHYTQHITGRPQDIFMVCTPIKGTPYYLSCLTYLSESSNVMDVPMSPLFQVYLDIEAWRPLENEWWKKK